MCRAHLENSSLSFLAVAIMRGKEEMDKERETKVYDQTLSEQGAQKEA